MSEQRSLSGPIAFVAVYGLWIGFFALGLWLAAQVHALLLEISLALQFNPWVGRAVRQLSIPILGLIGLIFVFWLEYYLRTSVEKGLLWRRTARVLIACAILTILTLTARALL